MFALTPVRPSPSPSPHSNLAEESPKETQAALPPLEVASPKEARKLIMKHTMLIQSCISQLGTFARAAPRGLAPHPLPFPPAFCPHPPPPRRATPPPPQPAAAARSTRLRAPLAHGINSGSTCCSAQVGERTRVAAGSQVNSRGGTERSVN